MTFCNEVFDSLKVVHYLCHNVSYFLIVIFMDLQTLLYSYRAEQLAQVQHKVEEMTPKKGDSNYGSLKRSNSKGGTLKKYKFVSSDHLDEESFSKCRHFHGRNTSSVNANNDNSNLNRYNVPLTGFQILVTDLNLRSMW